MKKLNYYLFTSLLLISLSTLALNFTFNSINGTTNLSNDEVIPVNTTKSTIKALKLKYE